jgi:hypothetical protein
MARHKKIAFYSGDWDLFDQLQRQGRVLETYEYTNRKAYAGTIYVAKEANETFVAIASNLEKRYTNRIYGNRKKRFHYYRIMFRLTDEGWEYLKGRLMEEGI